MKRLIPAIVSAIVLMAAPALVGTAFVQPALAQTKLAPKPATARTVDNCAPIGRTANGTLVYSMKCDNLPVPAAPPQVLFPGRAGNRLSRDAVERRLTLHSAAAAAECPSLAGKKISPHVLRHTAAMRLLHAGVEVPVIALWLGHEQTETAGIYLHADLKLKEKALARTTPPDAAPGRYRPPAPLLAFLESL